MSLESASERKQKRIVRAVISGFDNAKLAIIFGNTVEIVLNEQIGNFKLKLLIGGEETPLAITKDYRGKTVLKMSFLNIKNHNIAVHICDEIKRTLSIHVETYRTRLNLASLEIMEKPQPQYIMRKAS